MKEIKLTQGKVALVDDADFDWLNSVKWFAHRSGRTFYAGRNIRRKSGKRVMVCMHQLLAAVMGFAKPDHKDNDGLNNQRHNLRAASCAQNQANGRKRVDNTSGFIGVSWHKGHKKWAACAATSGRNQHLGYFNSATEAAQARDAFVSKIRGDFAKLNFT